MRRVDRLRRRRRASASHRPSRSAQPQQVRKSRCRPEAVEVDRGRPSSSSKWRVLRQILEDAGDAVVDVLAAADRRSASWPTASSVPNRLTASLSVSTTDVGLARARSRLAVDERELRGRRRRSSSTQRQSSVASAWPSLQERPARSRARRPPASICGKSFASASPGDVGRHLQLAAPRRSRIGVPGLELVDAARRSGSQLS